MARDTIFALSSGPGRAGVAVMRVSGPEAGLALDRLAGGRPPPRRAALRTIRHPDSGEVLDQALVLWLPAPGSFTGEDIVELQGHGGRAVTAGVLAALGRLPGFRLAEPGDFARRAFDNGKLELTAVEGLADLIDAETAAQRRQALRQAEGGLGKLYDGWRERLIEAQALIEAGIDFSDEADVSDRAFADAMRRVETLAGEITRHLDDGNRGEILRDGFRVVLTGAPNVGKSSLLNALARRDAAIVSDEPGTTRDVVDVRLDIEGIPVIVSDTAGLRETSSKAEQEGIRRTLERARTADLVLWVFDPSAEVTLGPTGFCTDDAPVWHIANKSDLVTWDATRAGSGFSVSALTGQGLDALVGAIGEAARAAIGNDEAPALTRSRHRQELERCRGQLLDAIAGDAADAELRAEDLRLAAHALGRITGRVDVEDILDRIFSRFCIGK